MGAKRDKYDVNFVYVVNFVYIIYKTPFESTSTQASLQKCKLYLHVSVRPLKTLHSVITNSYPSGIYRERGLIVTSCEMGLLTSARFFPGGFRLPCRTCESTKHRLSGLHTKTHGDAGAPMHFALE